MLQTTRSRARRATALALFAALVTAAAAGPLRAGSSVQDEPAPAARTTTPASTYDPLATARIDEVRVVDLDVVDTERERTIPIRLYLPPEPVQSGAANGTATPGAAALVAPVPAPVVVFSHGLGGSREASPYLGRHWAARGYLCVFLQHPGSDESVWKDVPRLRRMKAMRDAASAENYFLRVADVPAVLDQLELWNALDGHLLHGRVDLEHVGMTGHSFGAVTTQAVSGQAAPGRSGGSGAQPFTDARIDAALAMSPSKPSTGTPAQAFGAVSIPWMLMTGTHDAGVIGDQTPQTRREVYPYLPATIDRYELVLDGAEHSAFGERGLPGETEARNPNHHRAILALSTAFWDAYLLGDAAAHAWLMGDGARGVLEDGDVWQRARAAQKG
ncbi:Alpha/beta hydrolase family protein [Planctomycetes bacterium Pla163]|uniref:Alpha/beta hydrolase family protein n=1 Tax=Rohdeia mirabilis TaxID=2528008 RepID=A0A518CVC7_9BACT|nr:Alpha/beta hydrolase family protein [Planctomycetes bacterium Pla163]